MASCAFCNGVAAEDVPTIGPSKDTPAKEVNALDLGNIWVSRWDNPPIDGTLNYLQNQAAERKQDAWSYDLFDLEVKTDGAINNLHQNETKFLYAWPIAPGKQLGKALNWETHGVRLSARISGNPLEGVTTLQMLRDNSDPNIGKLAYGKPIHFQLDKNVALVPLHVIVLAPDTGTVSADWFTDALADVLLDDTWQGDKLTVTNPQESPHQVITNWNAKTDCTASYCKPISAIQPDRIFDQCDIQFRKVSFHLCMVPEDTFFNSFPSNSTGVCSPDAQAFKIFKALDACPGVGGPNGISNDGVPQLIFTGNLVQDICAANTLGGEKDFSSIITREGSKLKTTIAHELGHQLGLNHVDTDVEGCPSGNLMCPIENMVNPTTKLETMQCTQARKAAKSFQAAKWH
jgi:hypothetical protein